MQIHQSQPYNIIYSHNYTSKRIQNYYNLYSLPGQHVCSSVHGNGLKVRTMNISLVVDDLKPFSLLRKQNSSLHTLFFFDQQISFFLDVNLVVFKLSEFNRHDPLRVKRSAQLILYLQKSFIIFIHIQQMTINTLIAVQC